MPHRVCRQPPHPSSLKLSSPLTQFRHHLSLLLNVAAACPVFGRRTARTHYLQPPPQLAFKLPPRLLGLALSLQPWCHSRQRVRLLMSCCPLSTVAFRLTRSTGRHEGRRAVEQRAIARIMMRCISTSALRMWAAGTDCGMAQGQSRDSFKCVIL